MAGQTIRVGIPVDYAGSRIPATLSRFRERWPNVTYNVSSAAVDEMLRDLRHGELDVVLAIFTEPPTIEARHTWTQELVWVHSDALTLDLEGPVPLVSYGGESVCHRAALAALHRAGLDCNFPFTSQSQASLGAAVAAGFGVMALPRRRAIRNKLAIWEDAPLPKLPELYCSLLVREGGDRTAMEELADFIKDQIHVEPDSLSFARASAAGASR
jgi:DNA-binding transcriptional LysR family regulator